MSNLLATSQRTSNDCQYNQLMVDNCHAVWPMTSQAKSLCGVQTTYEGHSLPRTAAPAQSIRAFLALVHIPVLWCVRHRGRSYANTTRGLSNTKVLIHVPFDTSAVVQRKWSRYCLGLL
jgi:hypothetical protein